jgi:hypothetical protein
VHPYVEEGVAIGYDRQLSAFHDLGYGTAPPTVRTHRVLWDGWVETARTQAGCGLRLSLDHYHCSPGLQRNDGSWTHGYLTGGARPMKFIDEHGDLLGVYQQPTQLVDEYLLPMWNDYGPRLDAEAAVQVAHDLLRASRDHGYGPLVIHAHADGHNPAAEYHQAATHWLTGTLASARDLGLPIWSAEAWLAFIEARRDATMHGFAWDATTRRLRVQLAAVTPTPAPLGLLLPYEYGGDRIARVEIDGIPAAIGQRQVAGERYGWVGVVSGHHTLTAYYTPPQA